MPLSAAKTKAAFESTSKNPNSTARPTVVSLDLVFDGVKYEPKKLYEALDATYGTVSSDLDTVSGKKYRLRIKA